jgi:hypothetical protein
MILDFQKSPAASKGFDVYDAETGECLNALKIFYADDATGLCRAYQTDPTGRHILIDPILREPLTYEFTRPIRIVRHGMPGAS